MNHPTEEISTPRVGNNKIFFGNQEEDTKFSTVLKARVADYFELNKISKHCNLEMVIKTILFLGLYFTTYFLMIFASNSFEAYLFFSVILGFLVAGIGFNISHDAIHGGYTSSRKINALLAESFSLLGGSPYNWGITHNVVHHTYTNIPGADGDIHPIGILRFNKQNPARPIHRFQHLYVLFLYALITFEWSTKRDFIQIFKEKCMLYKKPPCPPFEVVKLFVSKGIYYVAFLILPPILLDLAVWQVLCGFILMHAVAGLSLAMVFQLGHLVEGPESAELHQVKGISDSWFVHQLKSSSNFSSQSYLANFFSGGLNCQIEHHLFPQICHVHYRKLSPIVKKTAQEFDLPYNEHPTYWGAIKSHFRFLKKHGV